MIDFFPYQNIGAERKSEWKEKNGWTSEMTDSKE